MATSIQEIVELIQKADKVLIGIGKEFSCEKLDLSGNDVYQAYFGKKISKEYEETDWLLETIQKYYLASLDFKDDGRVLEAYKSLFDIVGDKDYYIVNMNGDVLLQRAGFSEEKVVYPCGNRMHYQCQNNCSDEVTSSESIDDELLSLIGSASVKLSEIKRPKCKKCGKNLVYNRVENKNYCETGYLDKWKEYTEWTARTLNKKLCVLELGVNFQFPTVIRWPFEKIAFINNKADFIRVNEKYSQLSSELADKGIRIEKNAIDFLLNIK
ncbi:hypothetical protein [Konateibacter massiliensis]|uniref:hypothetical protein n=1 Tax=Konateibacter massiliensis TaxID=2002841 RepID=UPI000C15CA54|nr:hypothetical protein [Konateibacter massiliensis]